MKFSLDQLVFIEVMEREFPDTLARRSSLCNALCEKFIQLAKEYYDLSVAYHNRPLTQNELDYLDDGIEYEFKNLCDKYLGSKASPFFADLELRITVPSGYSNRMGGGVWIPIE